jgi:integrase
MPTIERGRKHFRLDKRFKGIGDLKRSSGTTNKTVYKRMLTMFDELYSQPDKWHLIRKVIDRKLTPLELYEADKYNHLAAITRDDTSLALRKHITAWLDDNTTLSGAAKKNYGEQFKYLLANVPAGAKLGDLPKYVDRYKGKCKTKGTLRSFNLCRAAVLSFVRDSLKKSHPLYHLVAEIAPFPKPKAKRTGNPQTVAQIDELIEQLSPKMRDIVWTCFTTGMGATEYCGSWSTDTPSRGVRIEGTKRESRKRWVPLVFEPIRHPIDQRTFQQILQRVSGGQVRPYDLRRSYAKMLADAGITRSHRIVYMGHADGTTAGSMTDRYEREGEIKSFLAADADVLRSFIAEARKPVIADRKRKAIQEAMSEFFDFS